MVFICLADLKVHVHDFFLINGLIFCIRKACILTRSMICILLIIEASGFHFYDLLWFVNMGNLATLLPRLFAAHAWLAQTPCHLRTWAKLLHVDATRAWAIQVTSLHLKVELAAGCTTPSCEDQYQCEPNHCNWELSCTIIITISCFEH